MLLLAATAFICLIGLSLLVIAETLGASRAKILAALEGRSELAQPVLLTRPVKVRIVSRPVSVPVTVQPRLRAAA